jgi:hypothetical protein
MKNANLSRERMTWVALVAALATSASWLAAISLALLARRSGIVTPATLVTLRALARAAWLLLRQAAPVALVALFVAAVIALAWTHANEARVGERTRHA